MCLSGEISRGKRWPTSEAGLLALAVSQNGWVSRGCRWEIKKLTKVGPTTTTHQGPRENEEQGYQCNYHGIQDRRAFAPSWATRRHRFSYVQTW